MSAVSKKRVLFCSLQEEGGVSFGSGAFKGRDQKWCKES